MFKFKVVEFATETQLSNVGFRELPMRGNLIVIDGVVYWIREVCYDEPRSLIVTKARHKEE